MKVSVLLLVAACGVDPSDESLSNTDQLACSPDFTISLPPAGHSTELISAPPVGWSYGCNGELVVEIDNVTSRAYSIELPTVYLSPTECPDALAALRVEGYHGTLVGPNHEVIPAGYTTLTDQQNWAAANGCRLAAQFASIPKLTYSKLRVSSALFTRTHALQVNLDVIGR